MNQLFYKSICKITLIILTSFWAVSAVASDCQPLFSPKEPNKESNKKESPPDLAQKYRGINNMQLLVDNFNDGSMQKSFEKYQEELVKNKIAHNPADETASIKIEEHIWFITKHTSKEDINIVRTILADKNEQNELSEEQAVYPTSKVSEIWDQFHGSIDKFIAIRKVSDFTEFRTADKSPWQLMAEIIGPDMAGNIIHLIFPVFTMREIYQLTFNKRQLVDWQLNKYITTSALQILNPFYLYINPPLLTQQQSHVEQPIKMIPTIKEINPYMNPHAALHQTKKTQKTNPFIKMKFTNPLQQQTFEEIANKWEPYINSELQIQRRLAKKIIKIIRAMNPDFEEKDPSKSLDW